MKSNRAYSLIEVMVYIVVLTVIMGLAFPAYYRCQRGSRDLQRNADDIIMAMRAGERWRHDVRAATGPIQATAAGLVIPQATGEITYSVAAGQLWRRVNHGQPIAVLAHVNQSKMQADRRQRVNAWRWELELASQTKATRVRPLFSFVAVAGGEP